jgi:hypothetical protein
MERKSRSAVLVRTGDPGGATMVADLELLLTAVFCAADDLLPKRAKNARRRITDAEVVTLCVAQALLGISSGRQFLRAAKQLSGLFPVPMQDAFLKRRARLATSRTDGSAATRRARSSGRPSGPRSRRRETTQPNSVTVASASDGAVGVRPGTVFVISPTRPVETRSSAASGDVVERHLVAAIGTSSPREVPTMPSRGLCRGDVQWGRVGPSPPRRERSVARHNHRVSRKASSWSGGR